MREIETLRWEEWEIEQETRNRGRISWVKNFDSSQAFSSDLFSCDLIGEYFLPETFRFPDLFEILVKR